jgi:hypothetical protein
VNTCQVRVKRRSDPPSARRAPDSRANNLPYGDRRRNLNRRGDLQKRLHSLQSRQDALPIVSSPADVAATDALGRGTRIALSLVRVLRASVRCGGGRV